MRTRLCSRPKCGRRNHSSRWRYCAHCRRMARDVAGGRRPASRDMGGRKSSAVSSNAASLRGSVPRLTDVRPCAKCGKQLALGLMEAHGRECWL